MTHPTDSTVTVKFIGHRESFRDHLYGTGLEFAQGQARALPADLARKFLRHVDQFAKVEGAAPEAKPTKAGKTTELDLEVQAALDKAKAEKEAQEAAQNRLQDVYDQVDAMGKTALVTYAKVNYRQELDAKAKVGDLRAQVRGFVDQYGIV